MSDAREKAVERLAHVLLLAVTRGERSAGDRAAAPNADAIDYAINARAAELGADARRLRAFVLDARRRAAPAG